VRKTENKQEVDMQRYNFLRDNFSECDCDMEESNIGNWVRYEDVERISGTLILSAVPSECVWTQEEEFDSRIYSTSCGRDWTMEEGTPEENGYKFCMGCGKLIKRGIAG
jgi:hypothetical protein